MAVSTTYAPPITNNTSFSNLMMTGPNINKGSHIFSESIAVAAVKRAADECRHQFLWDRWDCPKSAFNIFTKSTKEPATRETAFIRAIVSAAFVITLTKNCSTGNFGCGCDDTKRGGFNGWKWGGCSDNVKFGNKISKEFLDSREHAKDTRALVNLHNNKVGRLLVKKAMKRICKCHGLSGSCATQTCYMELPDFREVGNRLKEEHKSSVQVEFNDHGSLLATTKYRRQGTRNFIPKMRRTPKNHLIFTEISPSYCMANVSAGTKGTLGGGRTCSRRKGPDVSVSEKVSCKTLCRDCGFRVNKRKVEVISSCRCKFHWCCQVKCEECVNTVVVRKCS